ncbi:MAG: ABC transporter ATP-binding protein [Ruminococcaceae bacterium]|nr:ABC transporter ATP-binding protein [Oscillospiraceae bacterium]
MIWLFLWQKQYTKRVIQMIEIKSVTKKYGDFTAIENISLTVEDSSVLGLAGFNGSGKTTLLNVCAGIYRAENGCVLLDGKDAFDNNNERLSLFYLPDNLWFPKGSTIKSAAKRYASYFPDFDFNILNKICDIFGLDPKKSIRSLSKGMARQASLAIAFAAKPKYLLIDETFDGLDPHKKELVRKLLTEYINDTEASVIISSHDLREIAGVCDQVAIINGKSVILSCPLGDVSQHYRKVEMTFNMPVTELQFSAINYRKLKLSGKKAYLTICGDVEAELQKLNSLGAVEINTTLLTLDEVFSEETEAVTDNEKIKSLFK